MRISTSMIYDSGIRSINDQMSTALHNQQMLSSGLRVVTPADDPVAAARALIVTEAQNINTQFGTNQTNATNDLNLEESQMSSMGDLLTRVRQLAVQGGDAALAPSDLQSIATELRSRFEELLGIANTTDSNGDYIFSGTMGRTKPFGANVDGLLAAPGNEVTYSGNSGQRSLQVSPTRFLATSDSGNDIFRQIANGNGSFVTNYAAANTGTGVIDAGSVTNPTTWNGLADKNYAINFWVDTNGIAGNPGTTYYDIIDTTTGNSMLTGNPPVVPTAGPPAVSLATAGLRTYQDNQTIQLSTQPGDPAASNFNLGASVNITGAPTTGDTFTLAPSTTQSAFKTIANLIGALEGQNSTTLTGSGFAPASPAGTGIDLGGTLDLTVNGVTKTITIPAATTPAPPATPTYNSFTLANAINGAITTAFGSNVATASGVNGNIVLTAPSNGSNTAGISISNPVPAGLDTEIFGTKLTGTTFTPNATANTGGTLNLTINGVTQNVTIPPGTYNDSVTLANAINGAIATAFGAGVATASSSNGSIVITAPSATMTLNASAPVGLNAAIFGAAPTTTSAVAGTVTRSSTALANQISQALTNIDQAYNNVLTVRSGIGARLNELQSLSSVNQDVNLNYQQTLSNLQDVDYAKTISDLQQNQNNLTAAEKSFMSVTQLSLFNYLP